MFCNLAYFARPIYIHCFYLELHAFAHTLKTHTYNPGEQKMGKNLT